MDTPLIIALIVVITAILSIFAVYYYMRWSFEKRFKRWQDAAVILWQKDMERVQKQSVAQSRATLGGRFAEQLTPYLPEFKYDPTEARFLGSPIDLIVFPGLAQGNPREIVIVEVKTGKHCQLTDSEKKIRQLIEDGMVRWELIQPGVLLERPLQEILERNTPEEDCHQEPLADTD